jgi:ABC-type bacteriocin/lantibiotic exporter with double-glycine peptidase domain
LIWFFNKPISKGDLIALLWVTTVFLSRPLRQLPWFFTFVFDAYTSFKRLEEFLELKNTPEVVKSNVPADKDSLLEVKNLNLQIGNRHVLKDISLKIKPNELIALIGPVGAGKSLLIKSLINETPFTADVFCSSHISYLPQEHFIMSASLRDNMNFYYHSSAEYDEKVLQHLEQAQFNFELDRLNEGLETIIGERGVNLSGGQKQRVSLARQLMEPKDLLVLDDPLSAVDISTEHKMILEFLKLKNENRSLILTTQRFTALPYCDRIIFLNNGKIEYDGTAKEFPALTHYESFIKGLV